MGFLYRLQHVLANVKLLFPAISMKQSAKGKLSMDHREASYLLQLSSGMSPVLIHHPPFKNNSHTLIYRNVWGLRGVTVSIDKLWSWNDYRQTNSRRERRRQALPNTMAELPSNVLGCEKILCASLETKYTVGRVKSLYFDFFFFGSLSYPNGSSLPASKLFLESKLNVSTDDMIHCWM